MRKLLIWSSGLVALVAGTAALIVFATAGAAQFRVDGERLHVSGLLTFASTERMNTLIEETPGLTTLVLGDVTTDGGLTPILQKGYVIRGSGFDIELADGVQAGEAGVYLFLAGSERAMGPDAAMSVSDWMTPVGPAAALPQAAVHHEERATYVADMLGDDGFYWFMINAAPPGGGHLMSDQELQRFGLVTG